MCDYRFLFKPCPHSDFLLLAGCTRDDFETCETSIVLFCVHLRDQLIELFASRNVAIDPHSLSKHSMMFTPFDYYLARCTPTTAYPRRTANWSFRYFRVNRLFLVHGRARVIRDAVLLEDASPGHFDCLLPIFFSTQTRVGQLFRTASTLHRHQLT